MGCQWQFPPRHFLARLGVLGDTYEAMNVVRLPKSLYSRMPPNALQEGADDAAEECAVPEDLCRTIRHQGMLQLHDVAAAPAKCTPLAVPRSLLSPRLLQFSLQSPMIGPYPG